MFLLFLCVCVCACVGSIKVWWLVVRSWSTPWSSSRQGDSTPSTSHSTGQHASPIMMKAPELELSSPCFELREPLPSPHSPSPPALLLRPDPPFGSVLVICYVLCCLALYVGSWTTVWSTWTWWCSSSPPPHDTDYDKYTTPSLKKTSTKRLDSPPHGFRGD